MSARSVQLMDETHQVVAEIDALVGHLVVLDTVHHRVHEASMFQADLLQFGVANNATIELLVKMPANTRAHVAFSAKASGDAELELFEAPTIVDDGTLLTSFNRNRSSTVTADVEIYHTPDATGVVTNRLSNILVPGGSGGNSAGGSSDSFAEWILKTEENYLVVLTNRSGNASGMGLELDWYEPHLPGEQT